MFHQTNSKKEQDEQLKAYRLNLAKRIQVNKRRRDIAKNAPNLFNPLIDENRTRGAFNNYVDLLVIKSYMIEQLSTRLKINKSDATNFINKLNSNQVIILSKTIDQYIKYIQDRHKNINDFILNNSFRELEKEYNLTRQKLRNQETLKEQEEEKKEIIDENINQTKPAPQPQPAPAPAPIPQPAPQPPQPLPGLPQDAEQVEDQELPGVIEEEDKEGEVKKERDIQLEKFSNFIMKFVEKITTNNPQFTIKLKRDVYFNLGGLKEDYKGKNIDKYRQLLKLRFKQQGEISDKVRIGLQIEIREMIRSMLENEDIDLIERNKKILNNDLIVGTGYKLPQSHYITLGGKYTINYDKLLNNKLIVRTKKNNQVYNFKSQSITNNIKKILLKLSNNERISYNDIDKLTDNEKDQLYNISRKLHITELFDLPSSKKDEEEKLYDEFNLLKGSLLAGNNNPKIIKELKINLLKMKNKRLIPQQEYNNIIDIILTMEL